MFKRLFVLFLFLILINDYDYDYEFIYEFTSLWHLALVSKDIECHVWPYAW